MNHICLAGYDPKLLLEVEMQMKCYFNDHLQYSIWDFNSDTSFNEDATIVVFSNYEYHQTITNYKGNGRIILGKLTLTKEAYDRIQSIPDGSAVLFGHLTDELASGYVQHLYAYNFPFSIKPCSLVSLADPCIPIFIPNTLIEFANTSCESSINLDCFLMDRSTLIQIGFHMNLDEVIYPQDLQNKYKTSVSSDIVLAEIINRNNRFRNELGIISQIVNDAVIAVDVNGTVQMYNDLASHIFGYPADFIILKNGLELFKGLDFNEVLSSKKAIRDRLIDVNGQDLIVTINPIYHAQELYGAVAVIREFYEEEVKQHQFRKQIINKGHTSKYRFEDLRGNSKELKKLKIVAKRMSKSNSSVLIYGESGTGKELIAQAMHFTSQRSKYQFVALNCGALPESLLESELFGYEEGAFTGARKGGKPGLFELAHKGTIFLDEIGEMPISTQLRLLRILQEREVMRIGSDRLIKIDVRIIAASNKNLKDLIKTGEFREDLFYRLSVLPLKVPPLRNRKNDIKDLISHFKMHHHTHFDFDDQARDLLYDYHWPGNIRELRNYIEYWTNLNKPLISKCDLPFIEDIGCESPSVINIENTEFQRYIEATYRPLTLSIFILNTLNEWKIRNLRIGRRALYEKSREVGFMLSEHEIRDMLLHMKNFGYVEIMKGRGGTVITPYGLDALNYFQSVIVSM